MAFSEDIKIKAMVACGRRCCICHKFCGNNMELHHIKARADGGEDIFQNAIPLCFDCHADTDWICYCCKQMYDEGSGDSQWFAKRSGADGGKTGWYD